MFYAGFSLYRISQLGMRVFRIGARDSREPKRETVGDYYAFTGAIAFPSKDYVRPIGLKEVLLCCHRYGFHFEHSQRHASRSYRFLSVCSRLTLHLERCICCF